MKAAPRTGDNRSQLQCGVWRWPADMTLCCMHCWLQSLLSAGSGAVDLSRNTAATAGRRCLCLANQSACASTKSPINPMHHTMLEVQADAARKLE